MNKHSLLALALAFLVGCRSAGGPSEGEVVGPAEVDAALVAGNELASRGQLEEAEAVFDGILALDPDHPGALRGRSEVRWSREDFQGALEDNERLLDLELDLLDEALVRQAELLLSVGRHDEQLLYRDLLEHRSQRAASNVLDGVESMQLAGQPEEALLAVDEFLASQRSSSERALGLRLETLAELERFEEAGDTYDYMLGQFVVLENAWAHLEGGYSLSEVGRHEEARMAYLRYIGAEPGDPSGHFGLGLALNDLGRHEEALAAYEVLAQLTPDDAAAHNNRGLQALYLGEYEEALKALEHAGDLDPEDAEVQNNLGWALFELGRTEDALRAHDRALELREEFPEAHYNRGLTLADLGRPAEAVLAYDRALELRPDYSEAHYCRGNSLGNLGLTSEAAEAYAAATQLDAEFLDAFFNLGITLKRLERWEEALLAFDRVRALDPDDADVADFRGQVLEALGRTAEALETYEAALRSAPDDPVYREHVQRLSAELAAPSDEVDVEVEVEVESDPPTEEPR